MSERLRFTEERLQRPRTSGIDVVTTLQHFAIVTYELEPVRLTPHLHPRFEPELTSVLTPEIEFTIHLPPHREKDC